MLLVDADQIANSRGEVFADVLNTPEPFKA
jgi:hypothetical protein